MNKFYKKIFLCSAVILACSVFYYGYQHYKKNYLIAEKNGFIPYDDVRDRPFIKRLFKDDWYLLMADPHGDVDFVFSTRSPNPREPKYFGKMDITMLFENGQPVGVVTYYMKTRALAQILFLIVDKNFRGKRYGEKLLNYAFEALRKKGATSVKLFVRSVNKPARKLYERVGFQEDEPEPYSLGLWYRKKL